MSRAGAGFSHNAWPRIGTGTGAQLLAVLGQLDETQWWPAADLATLQREQLQALVAHALQALPFWRSRVTAAGLPPEAAAVVRRWAELPPIRRDEVQDAGDGLACRQVPEGHGPVRQVRTTGTMGRPLTVHTTNAAQFLYLVFVLREHVWQGRDPSCKFVSLRPHRHVPPGAVRRLENWGQPVCEVEDTGPSVVVHPSMPVSEQWRLLAAERPGYLLANASNLSALADHARRRSRRLPGLRQVLSFSEPVSEALRANVRHTLGVEVADVYSATEVGIIAFQCAEHGAYHLQSEGVFAEVVDDAGDPCAPGVEGRLLLTPLHNFAMPLLRYEIMDRVVRGDACPCGRGLPVIAAVRGRERNMAVAPGGGRYWPSFPWGRFADVAPIRQLRLVQTERDRIEVHYQMQRALSAAQCEALAAGLEAGLGHRYRFAFVHHARPIHDRAGKYEDFVCLVDPD